MEVVSLALGVVNLGFWLWLLVRELRLEAKERRLEKREEFVERLLDFRGSSPDEGDDEVRF